MPLSKVVAVVVPGVAPFELGVLCEVFGLDRSASGVPRTDFRLVTPEPGLIPTNQSFSLEVNNGLEAAADADLVCVPAGPRECWSTPILDLLNDTVDRGARVMSVCSGAFTLGAAGLLDGRHCTTHWMYTEELRNRFPKATVDPMVLYVEDGPVLTSAGTSAGIDLGLHILRQEYGDAIAGIVARRMVVPPHRDGGQAQYVALPVPVCADDGLGPTMDWIIANLDQELGVDDMASHALMSPRTFARRFRDETGTTPYSWLLARRVDAASRLLEETTLGVDEIASKVGFGSGTVLRHHFGRIRGISPQAYRRTFCCVAEDEERTA